MVFGGVFHSAKGSSLPSQPLPGPFSNGPYGVDAPFVLRTFPPLVGETRPHVLPGHPPLSLRSRAPFASRKGRSPLLPSTLGFPLSRE